MASLFYALLFAILFTSPALAEGGRAFPPDNCSSGNPFMAFDGVETGGNTYCINGQSVLSNALPGCAPNQQVIFDGTAFVCKAGGTPPNCAAGEFLTFTNGNYGCASTSVPTCAANQVLTYNGSAFVCVAKSASIPTCAASEFLTYNGTSFQCAATQNLTLPSCGAGEVLTSSGGNLACVPGAGSGFTIEPIRFSGAGSPTKTLSAGKKFSDYKAILLQAGPTPNSGAKTAIIAVAAFAAKTPTSFSGLGMPEGSVALDVFTHLGEGGAIWGSTIMYVSDTSFYLPTDGTVALWGIK
jgi:hypothetical protein